MSTEEGRTSRTYLGLLHIIVFNTGFIYICIVGGGQYLLRTELACSFFILKNSRWYKQHYFSFAVCPVSSVSQTSAHSQNDQNVPSRWQFGPSAARVQQITLQVSALSSPLALRQQLAPFAAWHRACVSVCNQDNICFLLSFPAPINL